jgi:hopene-associated glycosyltransferase HpnB
LSWLLPVAGLALAAWAWLLLLHGRFWLADQRLPAASPAPPRWPDVVAVVPARNEADVIGRAIAGLLAQDYPGAFRVVLVDDESGDGTADAARSAAGARAARLTVLRAPPREPGWVGKLWALESGLRSVATPPAYWWLTDADIGHPPDTLRRLVAKAEADRRALVSLMVRLWCQSLWERLLIPAFVYFFQQLYPFARVNDDRSRVAAAAGGCLLLRADTLAAAGGLAAMKSAVIDDCALAALAKPVARRQGLGIWLGLADGSHSLRPYAGLGEIWRMVARSAYTQLRHNPLLLLGTILGMALLYLAPPLIALGWPWHGDALAGALATGAWLLMAASEVPTLRLYRLSPLRALLLPLAGLLYTAMTLDSARRHWRGRGATWKGRVAAGKVGP